MLDFNRTLCSRQNSYISSTLNPVVFNLKGCQNCNSRHQQQIKRLVEIIQANSDNFRQSDIVEMFFRLSNFHIFRAIKLSNEVILVKFSDYQSKLSVVCWILIKLKSCKVIIDLLLLFIAHLLVISGIVYRNSFCYKILIQLRTFHLPLAGDGKVLSKN